MNLKQDLMLQVSAADPQMKGFVLIYLDSNGQCNIMNQAGKVEMAFMLKFFDIVMNKILTDEVNGGPGF